jgi:hypothetical protein
MRDANDVAHQRMNALLPEYIFPEKKKKKKKCNAQTFKSRLLKKSIQSLLFFPFCNN